MNKNTGFIVLQVISCAIALSLFARPENVVQAKLEMKDYTDGVVVQAVNELKGYMDLRFKEQEKLFREIARGN